LGNLFDSARSFASEETCFAQDDRNRFCGQVFDCSMFHGPSLIGPLFRVSLIGALFRVSGEPSKHGLAVRSVARHYFSSIYFLTHLLLTCLFHLAFHLFD
jgi:hypothetical protein